MSVAGKHLVITGGGTGVGAAIAVQAAQAGAKLTLLGRRLAPLKDIAAQTGGLAQSCDVTDPVALRAALDAARATHGAIAGAIANAGAAPSAPFHKITAADLAATMDVNLGGVFHLWQACLPDMRKAGHGRLIAIASTAGLKGYPYVSTYCAAKHAVVGLTRALAHELATTGITTNAICPGFIETPLLDASLADITAKTGRSRDDAARALLAHNPQARFLDPIEVAQSALWLCSDAARSVNGHCLTLSGGEI